ncbi:MAG: hypothetical protein AB8G23_24755 [Myxococcota bacterium]
MTSTLRLTRLRGLLAAALTVLGLLSAGVSSAGDGKVYSPLGCVKQYPWQTQPLSYHGPNIQNFSSGYLYLYCPIVKDNVGGTKLNYMSVTYLSPERSGFSCNFFAISPYGGYAYSRYMNGSRSTRYQTMSSTDLPAIGGGELYLTCTMPPGSTFKSYRVDED